MKTSPVIEIQSSGTITFPFDEATKNAIKALGARWQPDDKAWLVPLERLPEAREILNKAAEMFGWQVVDRSLKSDEQIEKEQAETTRNATKAHIVAFVAAVKQVPERSLKLEMWEVDGLHIGFMMHLDEPIYQTLIAASLEKYRRDILAGNTKLSFGMKLIALSAVSIIRALAAAKTQYLNVTELSEALVFDDGAVIHSGELVGLRTDTVRVSDWWEGHEAWPIGIYNNHLYVIFTREKFITDRIRASTGFNPRHMKLVEGLKVAHLEAYFYEWANVQLAAQTVTLDRYGSKRLAMDYIHPANLLLQHGIRRTVQNGMRWTDAKVEEALLRIEVLKRNAADAAIAADRANAVSLAKPKIEEMTKAALHALLTKHKIQFKISVPKAELVACAVGSQALCEALIGL